jgi:DNA-binding NarL/FixJ family response regulator
MEQVLKILMADDDGDVWANSIKMFMRDMPHVELSYVQNPDACRGRILDETYAIILLDISFSKNAAEGISLVPEIQARQPDAKIFMMSSHDDDQTMLRCIQLGATDFISKRTTSAEGIANIIRGYLAGEAKRLTNEELGRQIADQNGTY